MLAVALVLTISGCAGPLALRTSRQKYNAAIQTTDSEQLLLNLVRLMVDVFPIFLTVGIGADVPGEMPFPPRWSPGTVGKRDVQPAIPAG
jgi:hypothetical protein